MIVMDRNLGHGINANGNRVPMPNGDVVAANMRQSGYNGCLALHTGDSDEQLKMFESHYKNYYIDMVLDKHHLPSYSHICESFASWVYGRFHFGTFITNTGHGNGHGGCVDANESEERDDIDHAQYIMHYDICLTAKKELAHTKGLLFKMLHTATRTSKENVANALLCTVRCLQTTMQLLGAPILSDLCKKICTTIKRGTIIECFESSETRGSSGDGGGGGGSHSSTATPTSAPSVAVDDVLEVLEPTLVELFGREIEVMRKLIDVACSLLNKKVSSGAHVVAAFSGKRVDQGGKNAMGA